MGLSIAEAPCPALCQQKRAGRAIRSTTSCWPGSSKTNCAPRRRPTADAASAGSSFDLTGLPPTPEEVDAFVADRRPTPTRRLVDRLLASPHYGERWARHWLDVVRFAESHGFETNTAAAERLAVPRLRHPRLQRRHAVRPLRPRAARRRRRSGADAATGFLVAGAWDQVKSPDVAPDARSSGPTSWTTWSARPAARSSA